MAGMWRTRHVPAVVVLCLSTVAATAGCGRERAPASDIRLEGVAPEVARAVLAAQSAVVDDPRSGGKWLILGMVCEANGLLSGARGAYEQVTTLDDRNPRAWYRLAVVRGRGGQSDEAFTAIDRAIGLDGSYAPAHWRRGLWLLDATRDDEARAAFERAATLDPANPGGWLGLARVALHRRQNVEAVEILERFLSQHPGDPYALRLLGTAYQRLGRTGEAEYALAVGAIGEPVWPDPWSDQLAEFRVGFAQMLKAATSRILNGQFGEAIPLLERLLGERPDDLSLMHQLGLTYVAAGRASEGVTLLERALSRDPANLESHLRLASAYLNLNDPQRALPHAERAVALSPELGRAHEAAGMALWRSGRAFEALAAFQRVVRFDPANLNALVWIGSILLEAGRPDEAMAHFSQAARKNPLLADAFIGIGLVHARRRQFDDADAALQRAERLAPTNPRLGPARTQLEAARVGPR